MIVTALETAAIPHMVVGSFASTAHGEPRTTRDLDLVIDPRPDQLNELLGALDAEQFYVDPDVARDALRRRSMFNVIEIATGWKLDLVIRKARPFSIEEMQRRTITRILGMNVPTATAEDTIIAKLEWAKLGASDRQLEDVMGILRVRGADLDFDYIERWVTDLGLAELWRRARAAAPA
ncbi:MAG: nucleotidyltransferase family protein [Deltaproteobacteria bacterium]|nr:MAG: nucleotidyltransferase family protein [Deltaproteobacteria bacterium]TMQ17787.1 MAG: nucleotidyltransferase family protein [Deltaproteobacteria bacterium]